MLIIIMFCSNLIDYSAVVKVLVCILELLFPLGSLNTMDCIISFNEGLSTRALSPDNGLAGSKS